MNTGLNKTMPNHTGMWVNFFTAAGIPPDVAATYALTFSENRIQSDMLLDLNKEYLRDMGITRMGDVIAILRHAKQVHESAARDRVLNNAAANNKVPVAAVAGRTTAQTKTSPASRMLEHYTRNTPGQDVSPTASPSLKRKSLETGTDAEDIKKSRLIRFTSSPAALVKEGTSKVTVFARLGSTEPVKNVTANTTKPIYARLGAKANLASAESIPIPKDALKYEGILKSKAVKKVVTVTTSKNNERQIAMACTMRADEQPISIRDKLALPKSKSVKFSNHIEYKEIEGIPKERVVMPKPLVQKTTSVFNKPERRLTMPEPPKASASGIKSRLGRKSVNSFTITSGRLGV